MIEWNCANSTKGLCFLSGNGRIFTDCDVTQSSLYAKAGKYATKLADTSASSGVWLWSNKAALPTVRSTSTESIPMCRWWRVKPTVWKWMPTATMVALS